MVTVNGFATNGVPLPVVPSIAAAQPNVAPIGAQVTISGVGFGSAPGTVGKVTFNGVAATIANWSNNSITANVPTGASTGNIVVTASTLLAGSGVNFTVTSAPIPIITSLNPATAIPGALVRIFGQNLAAANQPTSVTIGSAQVGDVVVNSAGTVAAFLVPEGVTTGPLFVNVGTATSNSASLTIAFPPRINMIAPIEAISGSTITLTGTAFGPGGGTSSLLLDGQAATPLGWSGSQITFQAPTNAGQHSVMVSVGGLQSGPVQFKVLSFGAISGTVAAGGTPLAGALVQGANGQSTITDSAGNFSLPSVPQGVYSLATSLPGYVSATTTQISVISGQVTSVQISLHQPNPTEISISPDSVSLAVGGSQILTVHDQDGISVTTSTWSADDSSIADVVSQLGQQVTLLGLAPGTTTIHATNGSLSANLTVTVFSGTPTASFWSLSATDSLDVLPLAHAGPGPDFVLVGSTGLVGVKSTGEQVWQQPAFPGLTRMAADEQGDFVGMTGDGKSFVKISGLTGLPKWTHSIDSPNETVHSTALDAQGNLLWAWQ